MTFDDRVFVFEIGVEELSDDGGNMAVKVTRMHDGLLVAKACQHFVNYDYQLNKVTAINSIIQKALSPQPFEL